MVRLAGRACFLKSQVGMRCKLDKDEKKPLMVQVKGGHISISVALKQHTETNRIEFCVLRIFSNKL